MTAMKTCVRCGHERLLEAFARHNRTLDGRDSWCRDCHKAYHAAWHRANYVAAPRPSRTLEERRALRTERQRRWRHSHPDVARDARKAQKARRRGAVAEVFRRDVIYRRDAGRCGICHETVDLAVSPNDPLGPTLDHIIPLAKGGAHRRSNAQLAHRICNIRKRDKVAA